MGILNSAYSWLKDKVNSAFGSTPAPNMSLNTSGNSLGTPVRMDLSNPDPIKVYNPIINKAAGSVTSSIRDISINRDDLTRPRATTRSGSHSAEDVYSSPVTPEELKYLNAELASHYGMSKETAYQEALANTSYQRSVKDMQAAGLNPAVIYGAGKGSPADGVYHVSDASSGGGSGGSGGSGRRYGGSSKNNDRLFSTGEFYGISAAAGLAAAVVSRNPNSYWIGQTVAQGFMTAADNLFRR